MTSQQFWIKEKEKGDDFETIQAPIWDDYKDFIMEPSGYYALIRIEWDRAKIAVAVASKDHKIRKVVFV